MFKKRLFPVIPMSSIQGQHCRLEHFSHRKHAPLLWEAMDVQHIDDNMKWLGFPAGTSKQQFIAKMKRYEGAHNTKSYIGFHLGLRRNKSRHNARLFAVISLKTGKVIGMRGLQLVKRKIGSVDIMMVLTMARLDPIAAREAEYLMFSLVFDTLGYRRIGTTCDMNNTRSVATAIRQGYTFELVLRKAGAGEFGATDLNVYSIIDEDWPALKLAHLASLQAKNFDPQGRQILNVRQFLDTNGKGGA